MLPALAAARNADVTAIASRDPERARVMAGPAQVRSAYDQILRDPEIDAVYVPLVNASHREWTMKALGAGKHVLCEKPLALNELEAREMAAAQAASGRLLMEAMMYRFHPRIREVVDRLRAEPPSTVWISFGFPMEAPGNYRGVPELGGGALSDVGCYCVSLARWIFGEPLALRASARVDGVDREVEAELIFEGGRRAMLLASFDTVEMQELRWPGGRLEQPFTAWRDPWDPYQLMVEAFSEAVLRGDRVAPFPVQDSIANLRVMDGLRRAMRRNPRQRNHLAEAGEP
jgi:predicted dehydrogenase